MNSARKKITAPATRVAPAARRRNVWLSPEWRVTGLGWLEGPTRSEVGREFAVEGKSESFESLVSADVESGCWKRVSEVPN
jgi:hypothetical protein